MSLNDRSFQFKDDAPPLKPVLEKALQTGTAGFDFVFGAIADSEDNIYLAGGTTGWLL